MQPSIKSELQHADSERSRAQHEVLQLQRCIENDRMLMQEEMCRYFEGEVDEKDRMFAEQNLELEHTVATGPDDDELVGSLLRMCVGVSQGQGQG